MRSSAPATRQASIKSTAPAIGVSQSKHAVADAAADTKRPQATEAWPLQTRRSSQHNNVQPQEGNGSLPTGQAEGGRQGDCQRQEEDVDMADAMQVSPAPGAKHAAHAAAHGAAATPAKKSPRTAHATSPSPMDMSPCPTYAHANAAPAMQPLATQPCAMAQLQGVAGSKAQQQQLGGAGGASLDMDTSLHPNLIARQDSGSGGSSSSTQHCLAVDLLRSRLQHRCGFAAAPDAYPARPAAPGTAPPSSSSAAQRLVASRPVAPAPASWAMPLRPALQAVHDTLVATMGRVVAEQGCTAAVLLLGEKGTGKTLAVERALQTLVAKHNATNSVSAGGGAGGVGPASSSASAAGASAATSIDVDDAGAHTSVNGPGSGDKLVGVVHISGLLHLEERVAFQEIARQLCQEFSQLFAKSATYDENLAFLRTMLQALHRCMKSVVFIVDELDAFTRKGKQMLLYNLLDTLAHSKVQACVVGISCMQDVMDHMEKRVRSRFSAQRILVTTPLEFDPRVPQAAPAAAGPSRGLGAAPQPLPGVPIEDTPLGILRAMLSLPTMPAAPGTGSFLPIPAPRAGAGRGTGQGTGAGQQGLGQGLDSGFVQRHNGNVSAALQDPAVKQALKQVFNVRLRPRDLANITQCTLLEWTLSWQQQLAQQQQQHPAQQQQSAQQQGHSVVVPLLPAHVLRAVQQHMAVHTSQVDQLAGLSVLQLFLVVAMYRLAVKGSDLVNFEMAYDELRCMQYGGIGSRGDEQYKWSRRAALRAFQGLLLSGVAVQVGGGQSGERVAGRGAAYAGTELRCGKSTLDAALKARGTACPDLLLRFFKMEA